MELVYSALNILPLDKKSVNIKGGQHDGVSQCGKLRNRDFTKMLKDKGWHFFCSSKLISKISVTLNLMLVHPAKKICLVWVIYLEYICWFVLSVITLYWLCWFHIVFFNFFYSIQESIPFVLYLYINKFNFIMEYKQPQP